MIGWTGPIAPERGTQVCIKGGSNRVHESRESILSPAVQTARPGSAVHPPCLHLYRLSAVARVLQCCAKTMLQLATARQMCPTCGCCLYGWFSSLAPIHSRCMGCACVWLYGGNRLPDARQQHNKLLAIMPSLHVCSWSGTHVQQAQQTPTRLCHASILAPPFCTLMLIW